MLWNNGCPFWNAGAFGAGGWIGMVVNMLFWVVLVAGLVFLAIWLVRRAGTGFAAAGANTGTLSAREIAQMRYARGELSREEYLKLIEDLR